MKICFGGDLFVGGDLRDKPPGKYIQAPVFIDSELAIVNLEHPISDVPFVEEKSTLFAGTEAIATLKALGVSAVSLANNHIHDKGLAGVVETREHLARVGIGVFGAGRDQGEARIPFRVTNRLVLFGYCDFGRSYLRDVAIAGPAAPGCNALRREVILGDLDSLKTGEKAILYFHWGRENVWLPPHADIMLARELLSDERVSLIVGSHAHRPQGVVEYKGKKAFMCLGNLLFPNFYIAPPAHLTYPSQAAIARTTDGYHPVHSLTYKKWRPAARTSLLVAYDVRTGATELHTVRQLESSPMVTVVSGLPGKMIRTRVRLLSLVYRLPGPIYRLLAGAEHSFVNLMWRVDAYRFWLRELGIKGFFLKAWARLVGANR